MQPPATCAGNAYCPACSVPEPGAIAEALAAAEKAEVVILVLGDTASGHHLSGTSGEGNDRHSLSPSGAQLALLTAVIAQPALLHKLVLVHIGGRPMTFPNNSDSASKIPAILTAMRPGEYRHNLLSLFL
jgi:beta-xylosidase